MRHILANTRFRAKITYLIGGPHSDFHDGEIDVIFWRDCVIPNYFGVIAWSKIRASSWFGKILIRDPWSEPYFIKLRDEPFYGIFSGSWREEKICVILEILRAEAPVDDTSYKSPKFQIEQEKQY